jgi:DNA-binding protein HU-beta
MNTTSLVNLTAEETGQTNAQTEATIKAALEIICGVVASGEAVRLKGFGTFETKWHPPTEEQSPLETLLIPSTKIATFSPAKAFNDLLISNPHKPISAHESSRVD